MTWLLLMNVNTARQAPSFGLSGCLSATPEGIATKRAFSPVAYIGNLRRHAYVEHTARNRRYFQAYEMWH